MVSFLASVYFGGRGCQHLSSFIDNPRPLTGAGIPVTITMRRSYHFLHGGSVYYSIFKAILAAAKAIAALCMTLQDWYTKAIRVAPRIFEDRALVDQKVLLHIK